MNIEEKIYTIIINEELLEQGEDITVGFSGGLDSSVLLHILADLRSRENTDWNITAAHFNHKLRDSAERDEAFCRNTARRLGMVFVSDSCDVGLYAEENKVSVETAARECRYRFFGSLGRKTLLAHHRDDNAETILFNMIRGTGMQGIAGMSYSSAVNDVHVVRPMLDVLRNEICAYAQEHDIHFVHDETNEDTSYSRNRIRHEIIPVMEKINPSAVISIVNMAEHIKAGWNIITEQINKLEMKSQIEYTDTYSVFDAAILCSADRSIRDLLILRILERKGARVSRKTVERITGLIVRQEEGTVCEEAGNTVSVYREYGRLIFALDVPEKGCSGLDIEVHIPGECRIPELGLTLGSELLPGTEELYKEIVDNPDRDTAYMDNKSIQGRVCALRTWCEGDRFRPLGGEGEKKLQDFFTDAKVPLFERNRIGIIEADGEIIWVVGMRISDCVKVTSDTEEIVKIKAVRS